MRFILIGLFAIGSLVLWQSCKTTKHSLSDYKGDRLVFGSGGGFTGMVKEYWVLPNGQLFKGGGDMPTEIDKLKRRKIKKLFKKADKMDLINMQYNMPGNMYYYINYKKGEEIVKLTWGREKKLQNPILDSLFNEFMLLLPKQTKEKPSTTNK